MAEPSDKTSPNRSTFEVGMDLLTRSERGFAGAVAVGYAAVNVYSLVVAASPLYLVFFVAPFLTCVGVIALNRPRPWALRLVQAGTLLTAFAAMLTGTLLSVEPPLIAARSGGGCLVNIMAAFVALAVLGTVTRGEVSQRLWDFEIDSDAARSGRPRPEVSATDAEEVIFDLNGGDWSESDSEADTETLRHQNSDVERR